MNRRHRERDLASLDPTADARRWEAMVQEINRAAAGEVARRAARRDLTVLLFLSRWRRPAAAVYASIAAGAAAILLLQPGNAPAADPGVAAALGYPEAVANWMEADWDPSIEELVFAMEGAE